ncbi:hypothetical protein HUU62_25485 [Rhodoferax sp. 4810]|uniref:Restriction endonuclease NotI n=1 Tax=Thiospirillum jenense TaxID=1653858 RepID=A0A839HF86_9GAMM|nr:hypothetical protein [Thiospirillum jenense]MBB1077758.1 hypothetical protein [Rhodoferax jenense]MBB1127321.1 hypothetical protein [Thiospirillum jenense]
MSKIFELYGYRLDCWNAKASANREKAWCPFMNAECDGGGNRYLSALDIGKNPMLEKFFPGKKIVQSGVCSLRLRDFEQPWIVCPRRLLSLRGQQANYQTYVREQLMKCANLEQGKLYRAWSEVKMKVETTNDEDEAKSFDYTFDYVIAGSNRKKLSDVATLVGKGLRATQKIAENNQYTLAFRNGELWIDDFPSDPIVIVEIMTSSTSGGDKKKRTQIAMACEDAVICPESHNGPGINYRQVWARMVSQLIVKSQVGLAWHGKTFWLLQDVLAQYISSTTALDLSKHIAQTADEVNILAFGYGDIDAEPLAPIIEINNSSFYSGLITENATASISKGFVEIVKIGAPPDKEHLWRSLFKKSSCGNIVWE